MIAEIKYSPKFRFSLVAIVIGNALEWFDAALFGVLAPLLSQLFFPEDALLGISTPFLFFILSTSARPFGGLIFGYLGDSLGRRSALIRTILLMTVPLLLVCILPSYSKIGIAAPILLGGISILQGCCAGGELRRFFQL